MSDLDRLPTVADQELFDSLDSADRQLAIKWLTIFRRANKWEGNVSLLLREFSMANEVSESLTVRKFYEWRKSGGSIQCLVKTSAKGSYRIAGSRKRGAKL